MADTDKYCHVIFRGWGVVVVPESFISMAAEGKKLFLRCSLWSFYIVDMSLALAAGTRMEWVRIDSIMAWENWEGTCGTRRILAMLPAVSRCFNTQCRAMFTASCMDRLAL